VNIDKGLIEGIVKDLTSQKEQAHGALLLCEFLMKKLDEPSETVETPEGKAMTPEGLDKAIERGAEDN